MKNTNKPKLATFKVSEDFKTQYGTIGCYIENFGEVLQAVDADYGDENKIKVPVGKLPALLVALYDKVADSLLECEEKQLVIDFGDSVTSNTIETLVMFLLQTARNNTNEQA